MKLKDRLPTRARLREIKSLKFLGEVIFEPNLWHFNRYSVSVASFVGVFCCFLPMPFQMVPCVLLCVVLHCNVPLSIALVWISNPITMPPIFYFTYRLGTLILGEPNTIDSVELSITWLSSQLAAVWQPLILGSLICGLSLGSLAFVIVRLYWRWKIARYRAKRQDRSKRAAIRT
ncbi:MAG TPA: DUF2062 domain-containing protein [Gammaproteobacteria bacterium]|mgnify:CR=1 FL=1|nr:DUF2062 domain-containing protein [Gammaproteobacteria bacterium]